jgi:hypothetical protein
MEKSGRRLQGFFGRRLLNAAGLALFFALASVPPIFAVDVNIFVSTFELETSRTLHVEFSVRDVDPADVSLAESGIPDSFSLLAGQKERRVRDGHVETIVSRDWVPSVAGSFSLGPFTVTAKGEDFTLPPVYITVTAPKVSVRSAVYWTIADGQAGTGRPLRITLEGVFSGTVRSVSCPAPENALLEDIPAPSLTGKLLSGTDEHPVPIASWQWTPLSPGAQPLPRATFTYNGTDGTARTLVTPPVEILVASVAQVQKKKTIPGSVSRAFAASSVPLAPGGSGVPESPSSGKKNKSATASPAAETLAALRHAEYVGFFPRAARTQRLALERKLDLTQTLPVPPAAWKPVSVIGAVLAFSIAFLLRLTGLFRKIVRPVTFALFALSLLLAILSVCVYTQDPGPAGVLRACELYHVPETGSSVVDSLSEGTAVTIGRKAGDWVYVRTVSDLDGWVQSSSIIEYTSETAR